MFANLLDKSSLKQGDVIRDVVFPIARVASTRFISRSKGTAAGNLAVEAVLEGTQERPYHLVQVQGTVQPCAVLSQCCDVDPKQHPPPHSFVLCKLVPVPKSIRKHAQSYETLKANVDPYGDRPGFIQNFWFGEIRVLAAEYMADFAQVMTVSWSDYDAILKNKVGELDDQHRAMFRVKVGAHFGRVAAEDKEAGYEDPYERADAPVPPPLRYAERLKKGLRLIFGRDS